MSRFEVPKLFALRPRLRQSQSGSEPAMPGVGKKVLNLQVHTTIKTMGVHLSPPLFTLQDCHHPNWVLAIL